MTATLATELRTIRVYGTLADLVGCRTFRACVNTVRDAVSFLIANFPQVEAHIKQRHFRVKISDWTIGEDDLSAPIGQADEIHIIPAICGAGGNNGVLGILAGVALIGIGLLFPVAGPILTNLGIGLLLSGISTLISPTPEVPDEENDPSRSYNFSRLTNTSVEGIPVPLVYGEIMTGSVVVSVGIEEDEQEIVAGYIPGEGDPNPPTDDIFTEYGGGSVDICAEHVYKFTIEACLTISWLTNVCGNGYTDSCQEVIIFGRTLPKATKFPEGQQWGDTGGDCQCGTFYENLYIAGCAILFQTGPGICDDDISTKSAGFQPPGAVCSNPPDYVAGMNWSIVKTEIVDSQTSSVLYEVDVRGFPHSGFLDNL